MNNTLEHGLAVLEFLAQTGEPYSVTGLAEEMEFPASSTCRLLQTLTDAGFVEQDSKTRKYAVSLKMLTLANSSLRRLDMRNKLRPYLDKLARTLKQPVYLAIPYHGRAMIADVVFPGGVAGDPALTIGTLLGVHTSACGKLCAAYLSEAALDALLAQVPLEPRTPFTITDPEAFKAECRKIREQGVATTESELAVGTLAVAAPVLDHNGNFVGALGSFLSKSRNTPENWNIFKTETIATAEAASYALGFARAAAV
jgi:DNA-binding IclR family transcriptional regulator